VFAIACLLLLPATTLAQSLESSRRDTPAAGERRPSELLLTQALRLATPLLATRDAERQLGNEQSESRQGKSVRRRVLGAIVGATGGFFVGGYTGAWIEGDRCHCDDPGLKGALIGAPVGAAVGGVLGGLYLF
jgi:hypothetical protein